MIKDSVWEIFEIVASEERNEREIVFLQHLKNHKSQTKNYMIGVTAKSAVQNNIDDLCSIIPIWHTMLTKNRTNKVAVNKNCITFSHDIRTVNMLAVIFTSFNWKN